MTPAPGSGRSNPTGLIALVTGARGGIGREVVAQLRTVGHKVAAVGRDLNALREVEADAYVAADTSTPKGAAAAVAGCAEQLGGPPGLLAHCAGGLLNAPLHRTSAEQYREVMRANLDSSFHTLQAWVEALRNGDSEGAAAVLVSSVVARVGVANHEAIAAAKGGVEGLARSAAATYAPIGLRINAVAPGITDTPLTAGMLRTPEMREGAARQYPLAGVQAASQVAEVVVWLLSNAASRITGQVIPVDGGYTTVRPLLK